MNNIKIVILLILSVVVLNARADFPQIKSPYWYFTGDASTATQYGRFTSPETACLGFREYSTLQTIIETGSCSSGANVLCGSGFVEAAEASPPVYVDRVYCFWSTRVSPYDQRGAASTSYSCPAHSMTFGSSPVSPNLCRCDTGYIEDGLSNCIPNPVKPKKNKGQSCSSPTTNHPISIGTGSKYLREQLHKSNGLLPFSLELSYNSPNKDILQSWTGSFGNNWIGEWEQKIAVYNTDSVGKPITIGLQEPSGRELAFYASSSVNTFLPDKDINEKITASLNSTGQVVGWTRLSGDDGFTETYDSDGKLLVKAYKNGLVHKVTYADGFAGKYPADAPSCLLPLQASVPIKGALLCISNAVGQQIAFQYDASLRVVKAITSSGSALNFSYDTNSNLTSVTYPDGKVKTYHYGEADHVNASPQAGVNNAHLLTGITDENGNRYAHYYYDAQGRAYAEHLADGADTASLIYNTDASGNPINTEVTDARGNANTYNFTTILGVVKSTGKSQPAGSGCLASASALTYDANGNTASRTDFNGNKTTYVYDMTRNLETSRTEGLTPDDVATSATRTITTSWHPTWKLPHVISEYSGSLATGTPIKRTTHLYDDKGNITSYKVEDPIRGLSRITTTTYVYSTAVPGLVLEKWVDGPLAGANDLTIYYYYPHDASCAPSFAEPIIDPITGSAPPNYGCRGQLQHVIQPSGFMVMYNRYNHHGQLEEWTNTNELYSTNSYDLRQRLIRSTQENEQTFYSYDDAGLLKKITFPDAAELNYTYDNAHRLTEISNSLGDKVVYTLDDTGNRTGEEMYDSSGTLKKTIARQFDALNRPYTVTGE